jgi:hypothetical protein
MISRDDWEAAYRHLIAVDRRRLGPPPTFEEVEALSRGELPEEEAERVRERLSCYPDLLRVLTEPFPANAEGVLTDDEIAADLAKIRERARHTPASPAPPVPFPERRPAYRSLAIAAGIVIAVAIGIVSVRRTMSEPRSMMTQVLYPEAQRRGLPSQTAVPLSKKVDYMLQAVFSSRRQYGQYRMELLDVASVPPRRIWLRDDVTQRPDGTYVVRLSTDELEPGLYRLVLYGVDDTVEPLAEYTIRLSVR